MSEIRIGILVSGGGSNAQAVIDACEAGRINGRVVFVGSDNPNAYGLERAKKYNIPTFVVDYKKIAHRDNKKTENLAPHDCNVNEILKKQTLFPLSEDPANLISFFSIRAAAEEALIKAMAPYPFDLLVLAGFMRTLTPYFIDKINPSPFHPRIMNIHPALLPAFPGTDGYGDTYRYGCKIGGCTVHFIDYGEDSGAIIGQKAFEITPTDTIETMKEKGLRLEWELYVNCIQLFAEGKLRVRRRTYELKGGRTVQRTVVHIVSNNDR